MENDLYQKLLAEVRDEKLLWHGAPGQGVRIRPIDVIPFILSLFSCGFAIFLLVAAFLHSASFVTIILLGFLLMFWLYITFGRFLVGSRRRSHTYYGLTDRRALIIDDWSENSIEALNLSPALRINLKTNEDGSGAVLFGVGGSLLSALFFNPFEHDRYALWTGGYGVPAFEAIPDARAVYDLAVQAQQSKSD